MLRPRKKSIKLEDALVVKSPPLPLESIHARYSPFRAWSSPHTKDLRVIFGIIFVLFILLVFGANEWIGSVLESAMSTWNGGNPERGAGEASDDELLNVTTMILISFGGAIAASISLYDFGKRRLATVDLISMEIVSIVRVMAISSFPDRISRLHKVVSPGNDLGSPDARTVHKMRAACGFLRSDHFFSLFESNLRELGSLSSETVDFVTGFYTFLKALREQTESFFAYLESADPVDQEDASSHVELMLYLTDTLMSCACRAIDSLIESDVHRLASSRMALVVAAPTNNFLYYNLPDDHPMRKYTEARRLQYLESLSKIKNMERAERNFYARK